MGNSTSTQRQEFLQRDSRRFSELVADRSRRDPDYQIQIRPERNRSPSPLTSVSRTTTSSPSRRRTGNAYGTFRRQFSSHSVRLQPGVEHSSDSDGIVYEQEERPLVNMEELGMRDAPITHIAALPTPRQSSTMSRLGSRLLPTTVVRNLLSSGEETSAEGQAHRSGLASRLSTGGSSRFPSFRSSFRQRSFLPVSNTFSRARATAGVQTSERSESFSRSTSRNDIMDPPSRGSWRRQARLSIRRHSLSIFPNMLPERHSNGQSATVSTDDADHLIPPLSSVDHRLDFDESPHELDDTSVEARNILSPSASTSSRPSNSSRGFRRFHSLRSRTSARLIRRSDQPQLSQVLHLAAAAIAAQLSGGTLSNLQPIAAEGFDGNLNTFVQTLQEAATAHANGSSDNPAGLDQANQGPVNFLRVFQFPNPEDSASNDNYSSGIRTPMEPSMGPEHTDADRPAGNHDETRERSVTLVVVGVRSMPNQPNDPDSPGGSDFGQGLDTLLNLPFLPPSNLLRGNTQGALLRRSDGRSHSSFRRRSLNNFDSFPMQYESQRHHRTRSTNSRPESSLFSSPNPSVPVVLSESPPGPIPPPSTPAEPARSGATTPIRRPSSAGHPSLLPYLEEDPTTGPNSNSDNLLSASPTDGARQRRRSDSEFARRPELSSGATRRNGVVGPDENAPPPGRSWLIYVVGTSVSPDHPAFTMPSLFTDNPSYEDMQLLSTLLGPVKPPVATQADINLAGGVFRLTRSQDGSLIATSTAAGQSTAGIIVGERCLICLCDYDTAEEVRQLEKCQHLYHRECIDEWLTTGRNSCPLCRGQGVDEGAKEQAPQPQHQQSDQRTQPAS